MSSHDSWKRIHRTARIARIIERMDELDDETLEEVDRITGLAVLETGEFLIETPDRREFLKAAATGGALVAITGGAVTWELGFKRLAAAQREIEELQALVRLYEELEQTGLDECVTGNLERLGELVEEVRSAALPLDEGVTTGRAALLDFQAQFPALQSSLQWLRQVTTTLSQRVLAVENSTAEFLESGGSFKSSLGGFLGWLLDRVSYSVAERVREGLERIAEAVSLLPDLLEGLYTRILDPLEDWFSPRPTAGLNGTLVHPLLEDVIEPSESMIDCWTRLSDAWEEGWEEDVQGVLERRAELRAQIEASDQG